MCKIVGCAAIGETIACGNIVGCHIVGIIDDSIVGCIGSLVGGIVGSLVGGIVGSLVGCIVGGLVGCFICCIGGGGGGIGCNGCGRDTGTMACGSVVLLACPLSLVETISTSANIFSLMNVKNTQYIFTYLSLS